MENRFTELRTKHLIIRKLQADDATALCAYRGLPDVAAYQSWEKFTHADATRLIESLGDNEPGIPGAWAQLALIEIESGKMIGDCGLYCQTEDSRLMELGITLSPNHQGRGYAKDALEAVLNYLFTNLHKHRISMTTDARNAACIALCQRLGMRQEAHFVDHLWFKGAWGSEYVFSILSSEWQQR